MTRFRFGDYYTEVVGGLKELLKSMNIPEPSDEPNQNEYSEDLNANAEDEIEKELEIHQYSDYSKL